VEYTKTFEMMKAVTGYIINFVIQHLFFGTSKVVPGLHSNIAWSIKRVKRKL
jgi:hypothetical protein